MFVECPTCHRRYDDASRWTICPHNRLDVASDALLCVRCDVYVGYTNIGTRTDKPDHCIICGRSRAEIEAVGRIHAATRTSDGIT